LVVFLSIPRRSAFCADLALKLLAKCFPLVFFPLLGLDWGVAAKPENIEFSVFDGPQYRLDLVLHLLDGTLVIVEFVSWKRREQIPRFLNYYMTVKNSNLGAKGPFTPIRMLVVYTGNVTVPLAFEEICDGVLRSFAPEQVLLKGRFNEVELLKEYESEAKRGINPFQSDSNTAKAVLALLGCDRHGREDICKGFCRLGIRFANTSSGNRALGLLLIASGRSLGDKDYTGIYEEAGYMVIHNAFQALDKMADGMIFRFERERAEANLKVAVAKAVAKAVSEALDKAELKAEADKQAALDDAELKAEADKQAALDEAELKAEADKQAALDEADLKIKALTDELAKAKAKGNGKGKSEGEGEGRNNGENR
jgi:hypothetical protein